MSVIPVIARNINRRITVQAGPYLQNNRAKRTGGSSGRARARTPVQPPVLPLSPEKPTFHAEVHLIKTD
jgi:hypothetical protein